MRRVSALRHTRLHNTLVAQIRANHSFFQVKRCVLETQHRLDVMHIWSAGHAHKHLHDGVAGVHATREDEALGDAARWLQLLHEYLHCGRHAHVRHTRTSDSVAKKRTQVLQRSALHAARRLALCFSCTMHTAGVISRCACCTSRRSTLCKKSCRRCVTCAVKHTTSMTIMRKIQCASVVWSCSLKTRRSPSPTRHSLSSRAACSPLTCTIRCACATR